MPTISVIVPVYNVEKYLNRCVDSILNQTFTDFELILVDDGSTDNSGKICDEYAVIDSRVKVIHKENGGLSDARNSGIDLSKGEYLTFIDSDDWIKDNYLAVLHNDITVYDADISVINLHKEYDDKCEKADHVTTGVYSGIESLKFLYDSEMSIYINVAWGKLYKKKLFSEIRYPVGKLHEDGFTTYKLYFVAEKVHFSNEDLYCYYQREDSIMNKKFSANRIDEYFVYLERAEFFKDNNLEDLFIKNEKTRLGCIKSLTVKILNSDLSLQEKNRYLKMFQLDVKENYQFMSFDETVMNKFSINLYKFSYMLFYVAFKIKNIVLNINKK